jgi:hypothetical protein
MEIVRSLCSQGRVLDKVDRAAFDQVCADLENGATLNLSMIGDIFGQEFWKLMILAQTNIDVTSNGKINVNIITSPTEINRLMNKQK